MTKIIDNGGSLRTVIRTVGDDTNISNSDGSYIAIIEGGSSLVLPDIDVDIYVNGVFNTSTTIVTLGTNTLNITN